jgi:hypothetical protein
VTWDGVVSLGEMKAVTQRFGLSSSDCGRVANDSAWCGSTVVLVAVAWMPGGGRRPGWVGLGRKGQELGPGGMGLMASFGGKQKKWKQAARGSGLKSTMGCRNPFQI